MYLTPFPLVSLFPLEIPVHKHAQNRCQETPDREKRLEEKPCCDGERESKNEAEKIDDPVT